MVRTGQVVRAMLPELIGPSGWRAGPDENDYITFAAEYSMGNSHNVWDALYERPATLAMVIDVAGPE